MVGEFVAAIWYKNAVPTVPLAAVALEITGAGTATVNARTALPVPALFVALRPTVDVPAAVGVPEMRPVLVLTFSPAGSPIAA